MRRLFATTIIAAAIQLAVLGSPARAQSVTKPVATAAVAVSGQLQVSGQLTIVITSAPVIAFTPPNPTISCPAFPAGTVVSAVAVTGGDGNPIALAISDPAQSFVLSDTVPPANVIVGPNGIAANECPAAGVAAITDVVTVTATQP